MEGFGWVFSLISPSGAAVRPKRKSGMRGEKVKFEEAMISVKDCFTFLMPIVQQVVRASNKEIIERQDVMKKELTEKIDENEKKNDKV